MKNNGFLLIFNLLNNFSWSTNLAFLKRKFSHLFFQTFPDSTVKCRNLRTHVGKEKAVRHCLHGKRHVGGGCEVSPVVPGLTIVGVCCASCSVKIPSSAILISHFCSRFDWLLFCGIFYIGSCDILCHCNGFHQKERLHPQLPGGLPKPAQDGQAEPRTICSAIKDFSKDSCFISESTNHIVNYLELDQ